MVNRQNGQYGICKIMIEALGNAFYIETNIFLRQHNALCDAGGSGSKNQYAQLIRIDLCVQISTVAALQQPPSPREKIRNRGMPSSPCRRLCF